MTADDSKAWQPAKKKATQKKPAFIFSVGVVIGKIKGGLVIDTGKQNIEFHQGGSKIVLPIVLKASTREIYILKKTYERHRDVLDSDHSKQLV